jgi:hypothetical protein
LDKAQWLIGGQGKQKPPMGLSVDTDSLRLEKQVFQKRLKRLLTSPGKPPEACPS